MLIICTVHEIVWYTLITSALLSNYWGHMCHAKVIYNMSINKVHALFLMKILKLVHLYVASLDQVFVNYQLRNTVAKFNK